MYFFHLCSQHVQHVDDHHSSMCCNLQQIILFYRVELALFTYTLHATDIQLSLEIIIYRANRRHYDYDTERPVLHMQICYEED
jgi:hypothetical protein